MSTKDLQLVNFTQAKRLKKLGFDWETMELYHEDGTADIWVFNNHNVIGGKSSAPSVTLAIQWIRDRKKLFGFVATKKIIGQRVFYAVIDHECYKNNNREYVSWDEAESALFDELLSIFEKEKEQ